MDEPASVTMSAAHTTVIAVNVHPDKYIQHRHQHHHQLAMIQRLLEDVKTARRLEMAAQDGAPLATVAPTANSINLWWITAQERVITWVALVRIQLSLLQDLQQGHRHFLQPYVPQLLPHR